MTPMDEKAKNVTVDIEPLCDDVEPCEEEENVKIEPMNTKAHNRCLAVLDASEDAWFAFQSLRQLVESNDVENVRHIKRAVSNLDSWLYDFKKAMIGLCEEDA